MSGRVLPEASVTAEVAVLSGVLKVPAKFDDAVCVPDDFSEQRHRALWGLLCELREEGAPMDYKGVELEAERRGSLDAVGGRVYLAELAGGGSAYTNVGHYSAYVHKYGVMCRVARTAETLSRMATSPQTTPDEVVRYLDSESAVLSMSGSVGRPRQAPGVLLSEVKPQRVSWLWRNRIPLGKVSALDGDPCLGKSLLMLEVAARLSKGEPLPGDESAIEGGAVILSAEDGLEDTIVPRASIAGANLERLVFLRYAPESEGEQTVSQIIRDLPVVEDAIRRVAAKLVIVDVLMSYLPATTNSFRDQDVRLAMAPLSAAADRTGAAVVVVRHLNKSAGVNPLYRGGGSIGIVGAARAGMLVAPDPEDPDLRILAMTKSNLGRPAPSLAFRIIEPVEGIPRIEWQGESTHTATTLLSAGTESQEDRGAAAVAREFLQQELAAGAMAAVEVKKAAKAAGMAERTLWRAKRELRVRAAKDGLKGGWIWSLPDDGSGPKAAKKAEACQLKSMAAFGEFGSLREPAPRPNGGRVRTIDVAVEPIEEDV